MKMTIDCRLGFLCKSTGSVYARKQLPPADPIYGQADNRCAGYVVSVQGPAALESPRNEIYDRATLKFHISPFSGPPSVLEGELAFKLKSIYSQVIRVEDLPRTGIYLGVQPIGEHDFALLVNTVTLALLDAAIPLHFIPVCASLGDADLVVNIQTGKAIFHQAKGICTPFVNAELPKEAIEDNFKWIVERISEKRHYSPDLKR